MRRVELPDDETHFVAFRPPGWIGFGGDVCPACITDGDVADKLLLEIESDAIFGPRDAA